VFERYTESARRALFFARYEVSQLGASAIETEHVLLGLIRASPRLVGRILGLSEVSLLGLRKELERHSVVGQKTPESVEVPFSAETERVLRFAAEEADRLTHCYIGTEHLLLGLLREDTSVAGSILTRQGLRADDVRETLVTLLAEPPAPGASSTRATVSEQIERIEQSVEQLVGLSANSSDARVLGNRIRDSLEALKRCLGN
jgi:ATP-dependent Clp protease ATP-binding subunit ClpC